MKNDISRVTIDLPVNTHKKFKSFAASQGKTMRELIEYSINILISTQDNEECPYDHTPNKETIKAIEDSRNRKNIVKAKNVEDLFKKLGI